ncbi:unnamed protein product [Blepharisma stoltei]|uniref:Mitochondrial carrier protein n=1 Tax=Blepharisma stoltei TaxID=1481888 RepID=A0AAU9IKG2_9CILI|nr:unnamed protein product [Blepharisma stoltei]
MDSKFLSPSDFISGTCAGIASVSVCAPLDTARTRLQVQGLYNPQYRGLLSAVYTIYRTEGTRALYQGLNASIIAAPFTWSIYFPLYNGLRSYFNTKIDSKLLSNIYGASIAGLTATIVSNPLWLVRARMQVNPAQYQSVLLSLKNIVQNEGFLAFFQGCNASIFGIIHVTVQFPLYEYIKGQFCQDELSPTAIEMLYCTSIPKIMASLFSYPHEVMRSRLYLHNKKEEKRFQGLWSLIKYTAQAEGLKGFYAGFFGNLVRILPSTFITLYTYEKVACLFKA